MEDEITNSTSSELEHKSVTIHRSNLMKKLMKIFEDSTILNANANLYITPIDYRRKEELDMGSGVLKDVISNFWKQVFISLTVGAIEKVPCVRHDLGKKEWESIARILEYGVKTAHYFPVQLSCGFIPCVLFYEDCVSVDFLLKSFEQYTAEDEKEAFQKRLSDDFDDDSIFKFLSPFKGQHSFNY